MVTKAVLPSLLELVYESRLGPFEQLLFLLRLLAWKKLHESGQVEGLPSIADTRKQDRPGAAVTAVFERLRLGNDYNTCDAFRTDVPVAERLSLPTLERLLLEVDRLDVGGLAPEDILALLAEVGGRYGRTGSFAIVSSDLADLMVRLVGIEKGQRIYVPFDASFNLAIQAALQGGDVFAEYRDIGLSDLTSLINILFETRMRVSSTDPVMEPGWVEDGRLCQFTTALSCPPFGMRYRDQKVVDRFNRFPEDTFYGEVLQIRHIMAQTKGWAIVAAPNGLLFRTAAGERDFKADLIRNGQLAAVISLHGGLLTSTALPVSLLLISPGAHVDRILMVNASGDHFAEPGKMRGAFRLRNVDELLHLVRHREEGPFSRLVTAAECAAAEYNLQPERYVHIGVARQLENMLADNPTVPLEELVDIIRPQFLKLEEDEEPVEEFPEVAAQDLGDDGYVEAPAKRMGVGAKMLSKARQQQLQSYDVLLLSKGSVGKVALVPPDLPEPWLANQSFLILRLKPNRYISSPVVLMRYLASPAGQALLASRSGGGTIPMLQTKEVRSLPVMVPSLELQEAVLDTDRELVALQQQIRELQDAAGHLKKKHWALAE